MEKQSGYKRITILAKAEGLRFRDQGLGPLGSCWLWIPLIGCLWKLQTIGHPNIDPKDGEDT